MQPWYDPSPHQSGFITVNGVMLHYLDWGGQGQALVFLAGLGDSAHVYDDLAPQFTDRFRVLALTRRGHGESQRPAYGYELPNLVEDLGGFLDAVGIQHAILVGHSFGGDELTEFSRLYPDRVDCLVYLDSVIDRPAVRSLVGRHAVLNAIQPRPENLSSLENLRSWMEAHSSGRWSPAREANLRATLIYGSYGQIIDVGVPAQIYQQILAGAERTVLHPVKVPVLWFFAWASMPPAVEQMGQDSQRQFRDFLVEMRAFKQGEKEHFLRVVPRGRTVEMPDTEHHCFLHRPEVVRDEMRFFLCRK